MNADLMSQQPLPWYRYGWPWFLISIPLVSIVLGGVMLNLALKANNSLVVDDYYKEGKAINLRIERDRVSALLGLSVSLSASSEGLIMGVSRQAPEVSVSLQAKAEKLQQVFSWPDTLQLRWVHVTEESKDGASLLKSVGGSRYVAVGVHLPHSGKYRLHLQGQNGSEWRLVSPLVSLSGDQGLTFSAPAPEKVFGRSALQ